MLKRLTALLLCLLISAALAEPMQLTDDLSGTACYPLGSDTANAQFVYTYRYPQVAGDGEISQLINGVYQAVLGEVLDFTAPILYEGLTRPEKSSVDVTYEITCSTDEHFSVYFTTVNHLDGYDSTVYSAQVFSLTGGKAGQVTSLPYLLGILTPGEPDTWLQDRQTAKADACIRRMILDAPDLPASVDEDFLEYFFYPEEDFYMDADSALVFFLQPDEDHDIITFRFTIEEILDEI